MAILSRLLSNTPTTISTTTNHHLRRLMSTATTPEKPLKFVYNLLLRKGYPTPALFTSTKDSYLARVDMPGIQTSDLTYNISGSRIYLSGQEPKTHRFGSGRVEPRFYELDIDYDPVVYSIERVMIDVRSGVLWVRVPKIQFDGPDGPVIIRMGSLKIKMVGPSVVEVRNLQTDVLMAEMNQIVNPDC